MLFYNCCCSVLCPPEGSNCSNGRTFNTFRVLTFHSHDSFTIYIQLYVMNYLRPNKLLNYKTKKICNSFVLNKNDSKNRLILSTLVKIKDSFLVSSLSQTYFKILTVQTFSKETSVRYLLFRKKSSSLQKEPTRF